MLATQTAIGSLPNGHDTGSTLKSLKAIHKITSQYLSNKKDAQADQKSASSDSDDEVEAFSILTEVKQLLASSGLQNGAVTPPESVTSQPSTPPPSNNKGNISPLTLQPSAVHSSPAKPAEKPSPSGPVRSPQETIMGLFAQMSATSATNLFKHWGVFDAIPITQEVGSGLPLCISFADLARKVNVEEALLVRVSKMLTSTSILGRTQNGLHHTPTSLCLISSHPMSAMFSLLHTNIVSTSTSLPAYFDTYGRREPVGVNHVPITYHEGNPELKYFNLVNQNPKRMKQFMKAMSITHSSRVPTTGMYDMSPVLSVARSGQETVWVDIGGGSGHSVKLFLDECGGPEGLKVSQCVVHELEDVMKGAKKAAEEDELLKDVRFLPLDFHKESPVEGALVYYLRHIMRDYSDPVCANILRNVARSLTSEEARILISEQITPEGPPPSGASQPSSSQPMYAAFKDFSMLPLGGKERSLSQWRSVAAAAGLEIVRVHMDLNGTPHGVVELKLADTEREEVTA